MTATSDPCCDDLGWMPYSTEEQGAYWVEAHADAFTVFGIADLDWDGEFVRYTATRDQPATQVTPDGVY